MSESSAWLKAAALAVIVTVPAWAGPLEEAARQQKNGMWEIKMGGQSKPMLFCVTDATKLDGTMQSQESMKLLGCKPEKETFNDGRYEVVLSCNSSQPGLGAFTMVMKGSARADRQSGTTTVKGGGPMIQQMFPGGKATTTESRWIRPCNPGEKPGFQGMEGMQGPAGAYPMPAQP